MYSILIQIKGLLCDSLRIQDHLRLVLIGVKNYLGSGGALQIFRDRPTGY